MKPSILPVFVLAVFAFSLFVTRHARRDDKVSAAEARSVYLLVAALFGWALVALGLGLRNLHTSPWLLENVPLLWQSTVSVVIATVAFTLSRTLRNALGNLADATTASWLVFFQALRIGALGTVVKVAQGEIDSSFPLWVGIPDFLYDTSALMIGALLLRGAVSDRALAAWGLLGAAVIVVPLFFFMPYWMSEPGFIFIFEFPMVLAPSVVVPMFILLDGLLAWKAIRRHRA